MLICWPGTYKEIEMKIEQVRQFQPIVITLETNAEVSMLLHLILDELQVSGPGIAKFGN